MMRFSGKTAIITGSSNGIGRATAMLFATEGAQVTITGRNAERLEETRQAILKKGVPAAKVNAVVADVTFEAGLDTLIGSTLSKFGKIDILINNAGAAVMDKTRPIGFGQSLENFDANLTVNMKSVAALTNKAVPYLAKTKGDIVNISSIASGLRASPNFIYYSVAKAALDQYTRNSAIALIEQGIRVNSISPGLVMTGFGDATGMPKEVAEKFYKKLMSSKACLPAGRAGQPDDIAQAIAFLADRKMSSYIVGHQLVVDGGSSLVAAINALEPNDLLQ